MSRRAASLMSLCSRNSSPEPMIASSDLKRCARIKHQISRSWKRCATNRQRILHSLKRCAINKKLTSICLYRKTTHSKMRTPSCSQTRTSCSASFSLLPLTSRVLRTSASKPTRPAWSYLSRSRSSRSKLRPSRLTSSISRHALPSTSPSSPTPST